MDKKQAMETLLYSERWRNEILKLPVIAVGMEPPMDWQSWTEEQTEEVKAWALGHRKELPAVIEAYLVRVRARARSSAHEPIPELISAAVEDLVSKFLYYDRKEDEELSTADVVRFLRAHPGNADRIVDLFRAQLREKQAWAERVG